MGTAHTASLAARERNILFLRHSAHGPYTVVHGGAAGKLLLLAPSAGAAQDADPAEATIARVIAAIAPVP
jgi:hypothetical protein